VVGDLTSAFDFKTPNAWRHITLPTTEAYKPQAQPIAATRHTPKIGPGRQNRARPVRGRTRALQFAAQFLDMIQSGRALRPALSFNRARARYADG
jgi:phospholipase C